MGYKTIKELPKQVIRALPVHGQEIYRAAYNNAWDEYKAPEDRLGNSTRQETAHKVAWVAVKNLYHKNTYGKWVR